MGEEESGTQIYQCPSNSLFKLGVTAGAGAEPRYCHPQHLSRVYLWQSAPAPRSAVERAHPTREGAHLTPWPWAWFPPLPQSCGQHSHKTPLESEGRKGP